MPKAWKSCPNCKKSPDLVTLVATQIFRFPNLESFLSLFTSGQSYKASTSLESNWPENCLEYDSRLVIYDHRGFIRLATDMQKVYSKIELRLGRHFWRRACIWNLPCSILSLDDITWRHFTSCDVTLPLVLSCFTFCDLTMSIMSHDIST